MKTLKLLTQAITAFYSQDRCKPGVCVAYLDDGLVPYYASVVRYPSGNYNGKQVVCTARGETVTKAVRELAKTWHERVCPGKSALEDLGKHVERLNEEEAG